MATTVTSAQRHPLLKVVNYPIKINENVLYEIMVWMIKIDLSKATDEFTLLQEANIHTEGEKQAHHLFSFELTLPPP